MSSRVTQAKRDLIDAAKVCAPQPECGDGCPRFCGGDECFAMMLFKADAQDVAELLAEQERQ